MKDQHRKSYRHGNIPQDALRAARALLKTGGVDTITIRKVAAEINVAHRAIYNHFDDRAALLKDVAAQGFVELSAALAETKTKQGFRLIYLKFALADPHLYTLMMAQSRFTMQSHKNLSKGIYKLFRVSFNMFSLAENTRAENKRRVMYEWMQFHGGISLHLNGMLGTRTDIQLMDEMAEILKTNEI